MVHLVSSGKLALSLPYSSSHCVHTEAFTRISSLPTCFLHRVCSFQIYRDLSNAGGAAWRGKQL